MKEHHKKFDERGHEIMDSKPMQPPLGYKRSESLAEQIARMVRSSKIQDELDKAGYETFAEADNFEVPDDPPDPSSPFEQQFEPTPIAELARRAKADRIAKEKAARVAREAEGEPEEPKATGEPPEGARPSRRPGGPRRSPPEFKDAQGRRWRQMDIED